MAIQNMDIWPMANAKLPIQEIFGEKITEHGNGDIDVLVAKLD